MKAFVRRRKLQEGLQRSLFLAVLFFVLVPLLSKPIFAQLSTASVNGVVRDPSGASIGNATIVLRNVDTAVQNTTVSNKVGSYAFLSITPGRYTLSVRAAGFSPKQVPVFSLTVSQIATIDFSLTVGAQNSTVTVQGATPQLEVSSANLGTVIATHQVNDLPLDGRNFTELITLTPGAAPANTSQSAGAFATPVTFNSLYEFPAINGQSNRSIYFLTDGLSNFGSFTSTYAVAPIIDAIQEFKVVSHADSAEYGSVLGGVVNVVTKSGTNEFHGSAWEYARNTIFDTRSYFLPSTVPKTPYSQNQFGGAIGGPVRIPKLYNGKDRTFFFGSYQGFRYSQTSNSLLKVPTDAQLTGDESDWTTQIYNPFSTRPDPAHPGQYIRDPFPKNQIPSNLIDQSMVAWAKFMFPEAGPVLDSNGDNAIDTTPTTQTQDEWSIRVDQKIGANDSAWFRYSFINSTVGSSGGVPGLPSITTVPNRNYGGSYVHVFNPSSVLQVQFGRTVVADNTTTRFTQSIANIYSQIGFAASFAGDFTAAADGGNLLPALGINGYSGGGEDVSLHPQIPVNNEFRGNLTQIMGNHELHIGGGYISDGFHSPLSNSNVGFAAEETGDTNPLDTANSGDPIASFILNVPDNAGRRNVDETTRPGGVLSAFAQDSWRVTDKLTLNYGLRYDLTFIPPYGTDATIGMNGGIETGDMDFTNGTYVLQKVPPSCAVRGFAPCIPGDGSLPAHVVVDPRGKIAHNTYTNFGPRAGFAYRLGDKMVVRGGFGIVYDNFAAVVQTAQGIEGAWPDTGQLLANNLNQPSTTSPMPAIKAQDPFSGQVSGIFPSATPFNQVDYFYDPHAQNPMSEQWNLGGERILNASTTATLNYVGSVSRRLDVGGYYNTALTPGPGDPQARAKYPYIAATYWDHSVGSGNYNALQFSLNKRYTNGWSYAVAYTWSKTINVAGDGWYGAEGGVPQDPYDPSGYGSRSVAGTDLPNVLAVNTLYRVPVGRGERFSTGNGALDYILGNWQFNNIFQAHSGMPFTPYISSDIANTGNANNYETLNVVGDPNDIKKRTPAEWFNTAAYAVPPGYTYGTAGRNSLRSAGYWDLDSSLFRQFPLSEGRQFEFRAEAYNLFNHPVMGTPYSDYNDGSYFGAVNSTSSYSRQIQLALKFVF